MTAPVKSVDDLLELRAVIEAKGGKPELQKLSSITKARPCRSAWWIASANSATLLDKMYKASITRKTGRGNFRPRLITFKATPTPRHRKRRTARAWAQWHRFRCLCAAMDTSSVAAACRGWRRALESQQQRCKKRWLRSIAMLPAARQPFQQGQYGLQTVTRAIPWSSQSYMAAIEHGPFYAIKVVVGEIGTFAGLETDAQCAC